MCTRTAIAASSVVFILVGCGNSEVGPSSNPGDSEECGGTAATTVTLDGSQLDRLMGYPQPSGSLTLTVLERDDPPATFEDPFTGQTITAQGQFVGYRYSTRNDTNVEVQPATQINDDLRLTDGTRSWPTADYSGSNPTDVSGGWSDIQGDGQTATFIGAGFEQTTWAVFDVPFDASPTGLVLELDGGRTCIGVPPQ